MSFLVEQIAALQRIADFFAKLRGHELGGWTTSEVFAQATCIRCRAKLRVYNSLVQPDMDGPALDRLCGVNAKAAA